MKERPPFQRRSTYLVYAQVNVQERDENRKIFYNVILDWMHSELKSGSAGYEKFFGKFSVLSESSGLDRDVTKKNKEWI